MTTTTPDLPNLIERAQDAHLALLRARLARRKAERDEAEANAAYAAALNRLMPDERSHASVLSTTDLTVLHRPWQYRHAPTDGHNDG